MFNHISIVGGTGSGKSPLSTILAQKLNLHVVHLNGLNFNSNWTEVNKTKRDKIILSKAIEDK